MSPPADLVRSEQFLDLVRGSPEVASLREPGGPGDDDVHREVQLPVERLEFLEVFAPQESSSYEFAAQLRIARRPVVLHSSVDASSP